MLAGCSGPAGRAPGSDPEAPGLINSSSMDMQAGPPGSLDLADLDAVRTRGIDLFYKEVGMHLAFETGLPRVGKSSVGALLPLASVDEGAHSGQVAFYRWRPDDMPESGGLDPKKAQRWLIVPFLLRPNRVLENEQFNYDLDERSEEFVLVRGVITAAMAAVEKFPGGQWHMHPVRESQRDGTRRLWITRVYLIGTAENSPDLEVVVQEPRKKKQKPKVIDVITVHEPGDVGAQSVRTRQASPGPLTVARVKAMGLEAGRVDVEAGDGSKWKISSDSGEIEGLGAGNAE